MFRVFVPACGNQETTVITPLLGTGNQVKDHFKFQSLQSKEKTFFWQGELLPSLGIRRLSFVNFSHFDFLL